jgi:chromosome partitioning protein
MTTVFSIANQKGGVGKTTTAVNLAAGLARKGISTLLIDLDSQANATSALGFPKDEGGSLYGPFHGTENIADKILKTSTPNLELIPSEVDMAALESELLQKEDYLTQLRNLLAPLRATGRYRAIVLDCPPALGMLSMNSLAAADYLVIALQCEYLAMEGLGQCLGVVNQIREAGINPALTVGGIVMTMFDIRTNLSRQVVAEVRQHFPELVFNAMVPRSIRLGEAPSHGKTIFEYDPVSPGAVAYDALAAEAIKRFKLGERAPAVPGTRVA